MAEAKGAEAAEVVRAGAIATRLIEGGWSLKRLIRAIVLTSTYRMASTPTDSGPRCR